MHEAVLYVAVVWTGALLLAGVVRVIQARAPLSRLLALDMLSLVLIALLLLQSALIGDEHLLDAAVALALLSFVATVGAARYFSRGRPF
jgi:multicomponent Na+:H+ antiporter subunit F